MKSSTDFAPTTSFGLMLEGFPKSGKTSIALTFPGPLYILDLDNNLGGPVRRLNELGKKPDFFYDQVSIDDKGLEVPQEKRWALLIENLKKAGSDPTIKTIVIDGLTMLDLYLQAHIVSKKDAGKEKQMTISDWIPYKELMARLITTFRGIGKNFILISHLMVEEDEMNKIKRYKPQMSSKLQDCIGGFFSDVWLVKMISDGPKTKIQVHASNDATYPGLGNSLGMPNGWQDWEPEKFFTSTFTKGLEKKKV